MDRKLYIVHCVDTEGPLNETLFDTFKRLEDFFGIKMEPTYENLKKLQNKEVDLGGKEDAVYQLIAPQRLNMNRTWTEVESMLQRITSKEFRNQLLDSNGKGWFFNWFCMDHVGFNNINPRHRDIGYHNIYDHYAAMSKVQKTDSIYFHFHPVAICKDCNIAGTSYLYNSPIYDILVHKVIDRSFFPAAYRPGFHSERPDANWFLEQWIPFDYANQACDSVDDQPDLSFGRWGNWALSTKEWESYHPNIRNYQVKGDLKRSIARCLNMEARLREITVSEVEKAFARANSGKTTILSFCDHDFRDMEPEINKIRDMIKSVSQKYPDVKFFFADACEAFRAELGLKAKEPNLRAKIVKQSDRVSVLEVECDECFGPQPFLAIKDLGSNYFYDNFDFIVEGKKWTYTFDSNTKLIKYIDQIGIACNSDSGVTEIINIDVTNGKQTKTVLNK